MVHSKTCSSVLLLWLVECPRHLLFVGLSSYCLVHCDGSLLHGPLNYSTTGSLARPSSKCRMSVTLPLCGSKPLIRETNILTAMPYHSRFRGYRVGYRRDSTDPITRVRSDRMRNTKGKVVSPLLIACGISIWQSYHTSRHYHFHGSAVGSLSREALEGLQVVMCSPSQQHLLKQIQYPWFAGHLLRHRSSVCLCRKLRA